MNYRRLITHFGTPTFRLATTYLAIIMVLSIGFSVVLYRASAHELGRQIPPNSQFQNQQFNQFGGPPSNVDDFLHRRAQEGRNHLRTRLFILNGVALVVGGGLSYVLARRSLRPIEAAMEAQAQFVSDASHELRTPLTAIQTSNEVFLRKSNATLKDAKTVISHNIEDIGKLKQLSDGLLNLAKQQQTNITLRPVNLQDATGDALNQVISLASSKNVAVSDEVAPLQVQAEAAMLTQAMVILLDNAIKYSHKDGTVHITSNVKGKQVSFSVRDEGVGIRASELPHIFRRFYRADTARTHNATHGYGLGLAIAQQIITQQAGTITAVSTPGEGATFTITLPLAKPPTKP